MPFLIAAFAALIGLCFWLMNGWLDGHALMVKVGGEWETAAQGWWLFLSLGGPLAAFGLLIGLAVGVPAGSRLLGLLIEKQGADVEASRKAIAAERKELEAAKAALDEQMRQAAAQGREEGARIARGANEARFAAEDKAKGMERRQRTLEGRLKGAQQKAARIKKAQLMRGNAPKPA